MMLKSLGAVFLATSAANAFRNSSPFLLLSANPIESAPRGLELATEQTVTDLIASASSQCSATTYFIVSQPGLTTADLRDSTTLPNLHAWTAAAEHATSVEVANVIGELDVKSLTKRIATSCDTGDESMLGDTLSYSSGEKEVLLTAFPPLPVDKKGRVVALRKLNTRFTSLVSKLEGNYVFILASTPVEPAEPHAHMYEMDEPYPTAMHQDLKRGLELERRAKGNSSSGDHMQDELPLFEKYKFLSPGIFMSLSVSLLLVIILWVGVSAIAGLEVSYAAFSKEMGPAAQNKGKQQ